MGLLLGYLAEQEKRLRTEVAAAARILARAQAATGLRETLRVILDEVLTLFGGRKALLAVQQEGAAQAFLWEAKPGGHLSNSNLDASQQQAYFPPFAASAWYAVRQGDGRTDSPFDVTSVGDDGQRLPLAHRFTVEQLASIHSFHSVLAVAFRVGIQWSGWLLLLDAAKGPPPILQIRLLRHLVDQLAPAVHSAYLTARLRSQVGAAERARVAREIHDGAIQSLCTAELHLEALRRQAGSAAASDELNRMQQLLHQEVLNLRELTERMKPLEIGSADLLDSLAERVEKFRRETGIAAWFMCDLEDVALPSRTCRELARILQEALVNVRKHSEAHHVLVRFALDNGRFKLVVDDDGRGFSFSGRLSLGELDAARAGPLVIKERVRAIGADLTIESAPGRGARLEVSLPQSSRG
jgi:signal transduction histidine kinase